MNELKVDLNDIGRCLRMMRTNADVSQGEMAKRAGITQNFLSLAESGKGVSIKTIQKLATAAGCKVELLITFK